MSTDYFLERDLVLASDEKVRVQLRISTPKSNGSEQWCVASVLTGPDLVEDPSGMDDPICRVEVPIEEVCPIQALTFVQERFFLILRRRFGGQKVYSVAPGETIDGLPSWRAVTICELFNRDANSETPSAQEGMYAEASGESQHESSFGTLALKFAHSLSRGDFESARSLVSDERMTPDWLQQEFEYMISYGGGPVTEISLQKTMFEWPNKKRDDIAWVYLDLVGEEFQEALAIIVSVDENQSEKIREIEWGRP